MLRHRVIPVLLLQDNGLVKTKQFRDPVYLGDPLNVINIYNDKEVDELIVLDINSTKYNKPIDFGLIKDISQECFMPLGYGGGIKSIQDIEKLFQIGVEKIILNSSLSNIKMVKEAVDIFGSQSVVASVDIKRSKYNSYGVYSYLKGKVIDGDFLKYIKNIERLNVGEIFINNVDRDGMQNGYDIELINLISNSVEVPVIACGGAGSLNDMKELIKATNVSAIAAGSLFVFYGVYNAVLITYPKYSELEKILNDERN